MGRLLNSSGVHRVPGTWLIGSRVLQKGRGSGSQASLPDCPALGPGPATPAAALGLVMSMALIWHPINKLAALLLLPYLAWLTVTASIAYRLWRDSLCPEHQLQPTGEKSG